MDLLRLDLLDLDVEEPIPEEPPILRGRVLVMEAISLLTYRQPGCWADRKAVIRFVRNRWSYGGAGNVIRQLVEMGLAIEDQLQPRVRGNRRVVHSPLVAWSFHLVALTAEGEVEHFDQRGRYFGGRT